MSTEELRQNVFSSIHMSSLAKSTQANITYPSCTFCGGTLVSGSTKSKASPKRKTALCLLSLYTNSSESFVVWYKKEDPKGMLWMRTCCIRKGQSGNTVELISRGCRGRCSYTLKFSSSHASEEWYKLLKQESRKIPSLGDELPSSLDEGYMASLDSMLMDTSPLSVLNEVLHGDQLDTENQKEVRTGSPQQEDEQLQAPSPTSTPPRSTSPKSKSKRTPKSKSKICNPLQGLSSKSRKVSMIPVSSSFSNTHSVMSSNHNPLDSIENTEPYLPRWSWPRVLDLS